MYAHSGTQRMYVRHRLYSSGLQALHVLQLIKYTYVVGTYIGIYYSRSFGL